MQTAFPDDFDPEEVKNWDPKTQERIAELLQDALQRKAQAWYCTRGRICDGKPHDGYDYKHARGDQWPPAGTDWAVWLLRGGRGSGKTRSGSEWTRKRAEKARRLAGIGPTLSHIREVMVEGESGIIRVCERAGQNVLWEPSKRRITFPNGAIMSFYPGEEPDRLRGPEHEVAWLDEPAHIPMIEDVWDNLLMGLRIGDRPQVLCTTTPLPTKWLKDLAKDPGTVSVVVATYVNLENLAEGFKRRVLDKYEGTRLGRQELHGEILEDVEGALWTAADIDDNRDPYADFHTMDRLVVAIDPAGTSGKKSDETGIIVAGVKGREFYVFADGSGQYRPQAWAQTAVRLLDEYEGDVIVAEKNYGGEMVESTLRNVDSFAKIKLVNSRRGKAIRAEPVVALYQQNRVHHVGVMEGLEAQMTEWVPDESRDSPDRLDALVHAITELAKFNGDTTLAVPNHRPMPRTGGGMQMSRRYDAPALRVIRGGQGIPFGP